MFFSYITIDDLYLLDGICRKKRDQSVYNADLIGRCIKMLDTEKEREMK
jgi:hypothetical protein